MKIVIAGAGETGTHLAKMLSKEKHDIAIIDTSEERLRALANDEVLTIVGNPVSFRDLNEARAGSADLFVSVTPEQSVNITACMFATKLGVRKTFARINNREYLLPENKSFFENIGITSMIFPEMLAAQEIANAIKRPWTRQYWELMDGAFVLIGIKLYSNSQFVNRKLSELQSDSKRFHMVAVKRMDVTFIPNGSSSLMPGDIIYFITTGEYVSEVQVQAGKSNPEVKKVIIIGASRIAVRTCELLPGNIRVKLIEKDRDKCHRIAETVPNNVLIINGDGSDVDLLMQEGIQDAQAFIGLTDNESANIMACLRAKRFSGVVKTIAEVENLDYIPLAENLDIGSVVNKKRIAAGHIYQFLLDCDIANVKILSFANASVAELVARAGSKVTRKQVKDLNIPGDITFGGLMRGNETEIISGNTQIQANDRVIVFCLDSATRRLEEYFN